MDNFYCCKSCKISIRLEEDMPNACDTYYDNDWIKFHECSKSNLLRAKYSLKMISRYSGKYVLDIGCGTGILVDLLNKNGFIAEGIDTSSCCIDYAQKYKFGSYLCCNFENFNADKQYDFVLATQLIEHLRNPEIFLLKIKKLLRNNGYLYIETPNLQCWNERSIWRRRLGGMFSGIDHRICYTAYGLSNLLSLNGFEIVNISTVTYPPTIFLETAITFLTTFREISSFNDIKDLGLTFLQNNSYRHSYNFIINSSLIELLSIIPNKISVIGNSGEQLVVLARLNS